MRNWFEGVLLLVVGFCVSLMVALLAAQFGYTGMSAPFTALGQVDVLQAIKLSVVTATVAALLALLLAVPTGYALARSDFPGRSLIECLLIIPTIMSPLALGVALILMFRSEIGRAHV